MLNNKEKLHVCSIFFISSSAPHPFPYVIKQWYDIFYHSRWNYSFGSKSNIYNTADMTNGKIINMNPEHVTIYYVMHGIYNLRFILETKFIWIIEHLRMMWIMPTWTSFILKRERSNQWDYNKSKYILSKLHGHVINGVYVCTKLVLWYDISNKKCNHEKIGQK